MKKLTLYLFTLALFVIETQGAFILRQIRATGDDFNNASEVRSLWDQYPSTRFGVTDVPFGAINVPASGENYNINVSGTVFASEVNVGSGNGSFAGNQLPLGSGTGGNDWSVHAYGILDLPAGDYTVAFGSDDGGFLQIEGVTFLNTNNENGNVGTGTDTIMFNGTRGHNWTSGTFTIGPGGLQFAQFNSFFFERGGGDSFEIAIFNGHDTNPNDNGGVGNIANGFQLLADGVFGITIDSPGIVPEPSTSLSLFIGIGVMAVIRRLKDEFVSKKWDS